MFCMCLGQLGSATLKVTRKNYFENPLYPFLYIKLMLKLSINVVLKIIYAYF